MVALQFYVHGLFFNVDVYNQFSLFSWYRLNSTFSFFDMLKEINLA